MGRAMYVNGTFAAISVIAGLAVHSGALASVPCEALPASALKSLTPMGSPVANAAYAPSPGALVPRDFSLKLRVSSVKMAAKPTLPDPKIGQRDPTIFPGFQLHLFSNKGQLVPVERGTILRELKPAARASYWQIIPETGRVWQEACDGGWVRAALPITLVNDIENAAHQGLATFLYKDGQASHLRFQFVQETAPYLIPTYFVSWGAANAKAEPLGLTDLEQLRAAHVAEQADNLPSKRWSELAPLTELKRLDGFGGPLDPRWIVGLAIIRDGQIYRQPFETPYGEYPYPMGMRFGVRSVMKSIGVPLSLLRLSQVYGPWVLDLKIGEYVEGLHEKWKQVSFLNAANMATGFGGTGSLVTNPNNIFEGYLGGNYDRWYTAPSHAEKLRAINDTLTPYPWAPGKVVRYRDQDFYLLGIALNNFLRKMRGPSADIWKMLEQEVFLPIGIHHAPTIRTIEPDGQDYATYNAGFYPTLADLAKIAILYSNKGAFRGRQILHRQLTMDLLEAKGALFKQGDSSTRDLPVPFISDLKSSESDPESQPPRGRYMMGFHYKVYQANPVSNEVAYAPVMMGSGENEVTLMPNGLISIRIAKYADLGTGEIANSGKGEMTIEAMQRFAQPAQRR